jgi:hypothetical protein
MLLDNIYSKGITHDDHHMMIVISIAQATDACQLSVLQLLYSIRYGYLIRVQTGYQCL